MVEQIVTTIGTAMTSFAEPVATSLVEAFSTLFWVAGTEGAGTLTLLAEGLLALAGIGIVIGCVIKVYHIFSGRVRKSI